MKPEMNYIYETKKMYLSNILCYADPQAKQEEYYKLLNFELSYFEAEGYEFVKVTFVSQETYENTEDYEFEITVRKTVENFFK